MTAAARPGIRHRRRARGWLAAALALFAAALAVLLLWREKAAAYTPGLEAATSDEITSRLSRTLPSGAPRVLFTDAAAEAGIDFEHFQGARSTQLPEDMGSGAAWGDYDADGDPDLYLVNEAGPLPLDGDDASAATQGPRSALYRNDGGGRFTDVTEEAGVAAGGWGMGAAWGDYDGDFDLDLAVTRFGANLLYRNDGGGRFTDVSAATGAGAHRGFWTGASWADHDRDGDLDLYVCGYVQYKVEPADAARTSYQYGALLPYTLNPSSYPPHRNLLLRNDRGRFTDVARRAGVDNPAGRSLSATWADFDADGWPDLYVANDISDNALYLNRGDGTFRDASHPAWVADYRGAMGLAVGDWEDDGDLDLFITHWLAQENALYENLKDRMGPADAEPVRFIDRADMLGLGQIALDMVGWGTGFFDYDNDGRLDLFAANGSTLPLEDDPARLAPMKNQLFWNAGPEAGFYETGQATGGAFLQDNVGRGAAFADYDGDGDLDIAVNVNGGRARLLRNDGEDLGAWTRVRVRGAVAGAGRTSRGRRAAAHATTTFAAGAVIKVTAGGRMQTRLIGGGSSYLSQDPPGEAHVGLGVAGRIERLQILWPSGRTETHEDLPARAVITLVEGEPPSVASPRAAAPSPGLPDRALIAAFWEHYRAASAARARGESAEAEASYREALRLDPRHEDSLYHRGQILQEMGRSGEALAMFRRLVEVNDQSARGHLAIGAALSSADPGGPWDLEAAESHLRRAHAINGEETGSMLRLGELRLVRGDLGEAERWLNAAARTNARSVEAAFLSGLVRWSRGDHAAALGWYASALQAARVETPVRGVLNEGDRKTSPAARPVPAAGRALFDDLCSRLEALGAEEAYAEAGRRAGELSRRPPRPL
ncbi:MAG TPA: FG-GAP-like repeat-containing protein [Candidatus Polarisedimenticolia bacterium]|nr:FG-GAP-like repeat-containing protein [Candidatus Polarisedimenticolia bacterium]